MIGSSRTSARYRVAPPALARDARGAGARYGYEGSAPDAPGAELVLEKLEALERERDGTHARHQKNELGLVFVVRLLEFEKPVNWYRAGLAEMLAEADAGRLEGNASLRAGRLELAREKYEKTLRDLRGIRGLQSEEEVSAVNAIVTAVTLNLTAAFQRLGLHARAIAKADEILEADPAHIKALWRRGDGDGGTAHHLNARGADGLDQLALEIATQVDNDHIRSGAVKRQRRTIGIVIVGKDDGPVAGNNAVAVDVAADSAGQHHARKVVSGEYQRALMRALCQDRLVGTNFPHALTWQVNRALAKMVCHPFGQGDVVMVHKAKHGGAWQ